VGARCRYEEAAAKVFPRKRGKTFLNAFPRSANHATIELSKQSVFCLPTARTREERRGEGPNYDDPENTIIPYFDYDAYA